MILYHAITTYHVLKCAVHKLRYHPDEDAILIYHTSLLHKFSGLIKRKENSVFVKIGEFTWDRKYDGKQGVNCSGIEKEFKELVGGLTLDDFEEINVCRAEYFFGLWLVENKCSFQWFEDADGTLSNHDQIMKNDSIGKPARYELAAKCGLYDGDNPYVTKKVVNYRAQAPGFSDPKAIDFDVMREMEQLSPEQKTALLDFFDVPRENAFVQNSALMLTAHFCNLRMMTYEEHALCYQLTTDYFLENYNIYYKWHPSDFMPYQTFMENVKMVPAHFPSELLSLVLDTPFEVGASINSAGLENLKKIYKKRLLFNDVYLKTFWYDHQYYFARKLIELLPEHHICAVGVNQAQLDNMLEFGGPETITRPVSYCSDLQQLIPDSGPRLVIVGDQCQLSEADLLAFRNGWTEKDVVLFLNEEDDYPCYCLMTEESFLIKELWLSAIDQDEYGKLKSCKRTVLFTRSAEIRRKIEAMKFVKRLLNTGVELDVLATSDQETQIAALKGMLKATETQLVKYAEENRELKEKSGKNK